MKKGLQTKRTSQRILGSSKRRITTQRTLLLDILKNEGRHLDANELYERARRKQPRLSLSTVYRNLQLFKKLGLVEEHRFAEEHGHYEVRSDVGHSHLLCLGCGAVVEFDYPLSHQLQEDVSREHGFEIMGVEVSMTGLCPKCLSKK